MRRINLSFPVGGFSCERGSLLQAIDGSRESVCVDAVSVGESRVSSFLSRILKPKSDAERRLPLRLTLIGTFDPLISFFCHRLSRLRLLAS